jgi:hypothetical protein
LTQEQLNRLSDDVHSALQYHNSGINDLMLALIGLADGRVEVPAFVATVGVFVNRSENLTAMLNNIGAWTYGARRNEDAENGETHAQVAVDENTSDGYHTFKELYRYRKLYNAGFFNMLAAHTEVPVVKSWRHNDGKECFGGSWFIVVANLPTGQVSNHYEAKDWHLFSIPEVERAPEWDGHDPNEAADRIEKFLIGYESVYGMVMRDDTP